MIGLALSLVLAAADSAPVDDPLAPAWTGKVQCFTPDKAKKTCVSIGAYAKLPNGLIDNRAVVLVTKSPLIVMETHAPVSVKAGAICGPLSQHDIDTATFKVDGAPANEKQSGLLRDLLAKQLAPMFGHEVCSTYTPAGDHLTVRSTDSGQAQPREMSVIWVPEAEYHVGP